NIPEGLSGRYSSTFHSFTACFRPIVLNKIQIILMPVNQEVNIHKNILHLFTETLIYAVMKLDGKHIARALSNSPAVAYVLPVLPLRPIRRPRALLGS